jgi:hypothetical protein
MHKRITIIAFFAFVGTAPARAADWPRNVVLMSEYLSHQIEGYTQITFAGKIEDTGGSGELTLDPNACSLNQFGDKEICTLIAPTVRTVKLQRLRTADPAGLNRRLYSASGTGLSNRNPIVFVVPDALDGHYRLVYSTRNGQRHVVPLERRTYTVAAKADADKATDRSPCRALARTVDGETAQAKVVPGFVNGTYILIVQGKVPIANATVKLHPVVYTRKPEYWRIHVLQCVGDVVLPAIGEYTASLPIDNYRGTKGIEVMWANGESVKLDVPPPPNGK